MICQICGRLVSKLYPAKFADDPDDTVGYTQLVCEDCWPYDDELPEPVDETDSGVPKGG